ncbi:MAG: phytanoyl-CoA dioxygenase family protein [Alphaproteobacteria bacterium]|nr:phytanoyl-CoA dioxygenase family protein [Alphaproteobacteria bacterium]
MTAAQVDAFIRDGFVRLEAAFPRALAAQCRRLLWAQTGLDPRAPATWRQPVIRLPGSDAAALVRAANTRRLHGAFDQLVGVGRWRPRPTMGTFPIRFPSTVDPGDAGWHIDGSYALDGTYYANLWSHERALLMLFLFSDVGPDDAPTRIRVGSHLDVPRVLAIAGDRGMPFGHVVSLLPHVHRRRLTLATGRAGDVYLCHPFLVHAASWPHRGSAPRFIAQPPLAPVEALRLHRADGAYSPVETAVRIGLGLQRRPAPRPRKK